MLTIMSEWKHFTFHNSNRISVGFVYNKYEFKRIFQEAVTVLLQNTATFK